ncbi:MAG: SIS domain-containing protein [Bifidobacterium sp.]|uniref:SIS domain-containing protein n=1 Tax=Bifidobacterium fermentum TaxID=3059035 RepID=A0AB39UBT2_9BIFI
MEDNRNEPNVTELVNDVFDKEIDALRSIQHDVNSSYQDAIDLLLACKGKVVFTGVGKSGHIGEKLAATFASVGIPSFFMHSTEAVHGDLGMVSESDVVIAISNSGETQEVLRVLPSLKAKKVKIVSMTGNNDSSLARAADVSLVIHVDSEADKFNLAPSCSSTGVLVAGDAIGLTLSRLIGFTEEGFGLNHPGGALGKKLVAQGILKEL